MRLVYSAGWLGAPLAWALWSACLAGCAGGKKGGTNHSDRYGVSALTTPFYKYGPAQAFGADASLPKGQKVTLVKRSLGFSQVRLENGEMGYVATEDLTQLPPEPVPKATPKAKLAANRRSSPPPPPLPERTLDLTDSPMLPLPANEPPPKPAFRLH